MTNLQLIINKNINRKNTVQNFRFYDAQSIYRVVIMFKQHFKCTLKEAFLRYANFICSGNSNI